MQNASAVKTLDSERYREEVWRQIESGILVCPVTRQKLTRQSPESLETESGENSYRVLYGRLPMLVADHNLVDEYAKSSVQMNQEYTAEYLEKQERWINKLRGHDYRTEASIRAKNAIFENLEKDSVCISIGGGPTRADPNLLNLNIGPFPNVDIVADAHNLPYANDSVDAIHCEAVFEHLHTPTVAAAEIFRVLRRGGKAFICTPFLQTYHGYPHHYQNFTLTGHTALFEKAGLKIIESGTCVGPTFVLRNMISVFIATYSPSPIRGVLRAIWAAISMTIAPLDILLRKSSNSHIMASTTYLLAEKPGN